MPLGASPLVLTENAKWAEHDKKSNAVELASVFDRIKPCELPHGSYLKFHTPLRGEQQATIDSDRLRCEEWNLW